MLLTCWILQCCVEVSVHRVTLPTVCYKTWCCGSRSVSVRDARAGRRRRGDAAALGAFAACAPRRRTRACAAALPVWREYQQPTGAMVSAQNQKCYMHLVIELLGVHPGEYTTILIFLSPNCHACIVVFLFEVSYKITSEQTVQAGTVQCHAGHVKIRCDLKDIAVIMIRGYRLASGEH